jgi:hypothetical protein
MHFIFSLLAEWVRLDESGSDSDDPRNHDPVNTVTASAGPAAAPGLAAATTRDLDDRNTADPGHDCGS